MNLKLSALSERLRGSLFFVPMLFVLAGIVLGQVAVSVDVATSEGADRLPLGFTSTVESARQVLSTIAAATITVAGIAFSVSLLVIQLASSQYSPRVVHSLFRDATNKRLMGLVVGTFAYCLVVLRSVRGAVGDGGEPVVPNLSVAIAVLLGITAILAILYFIDHSARTMDVSQILQSVTDLTIGQARRDWPESDPDAPGRPAPAQVHEAVPDGPGTLVRFGRSGWVEQLDQDAFLRLAPPGGTVWLGTAPGRYAVTGSPLCTVWPPAGDSDELTERAHEAVQVGNARTMRQDVAYGLRQLADVGIRALSPGVNDPTTAQDAIFHVAAVVAELLRREPPSPIRVDGDGRRLLIPETPTHEDLVATGFEELRRAAAPHPRVCIYLLESLHLVRQAVEGAGLDRRAGLLADQARLLLEAAEAEAGGEDRAQVRRAWEQRFGPDRPGPEGKGSGLEPFR